MMNCEEPRHSRPFFFGDGSGCFFSAPSAALVKEIQIVLAGEPISEALARLLSARQAEGRRDWAKA